MWRRVASLSRLVSSSESHCRNQVAYGFNAWRSFATKVLNPAEDGVSGRRRTPFVAFVLGGPGSGKGTQCTRIVENFGFTHLSAGDLLRKEISSNTGNGAMILNTIREGKIVPSEVTVKLIQNAIEASENERFLIDGFPRSEENRTSYERVMEAEPDIVLFFDCPEVEMVKRVLNRNQGRIDDNIDTVKERLKVFAELNLPVIKHYSKRGKLYKIDGTGTQDEIYERVRPVFTALNLRYLFHVSSCLRSWLKSALPVDFDCLANMYNHLGQRISNIYLRVQFLDVYLGHMMSNSGK